MNRVLPFPAARLRDTSPEMDRIWRAEVERRIRWWRFRRAAREVLPWLGVLAMVAVAVLMVMA